MHCSLLISLRNYKSYTIAQERGKAVVYKTCGVITKHRRLFFAIAPSQKERLVVVKAEQWMARA